MPKFLDIPSWYGTNGTLLYPLSYNQNNWPNGLTMGSLQLNGDASIPIFTDMNYSRQWYAPTSAGYNGQILRSVGSGAPVWKSVQISVVMISPNPSSSSMAIAIVPSLNGIPNNGPMLNRALGECGVPGFVSGYNCIPANGIESYSDVVAIYSTGSGNVTLLKADRSVVSLPIGTGYNTTITCKQFL